VIAALCASMLRLARDIHWRYARAPAEEVTLD
jgi:hypothetical protein